VSRRNRVALVGAGALILVIAGSALALRAPNLPNAPAQVTSSHEPQVDTPPTAEELAHARDRLEANGIAADDATLADLAGRYGLGGAVRLYAWSDETGLAIEELASRYDEGTGWGVLAKELDVHPGIGSIMGNGHGRDGAPGLQKQREEPAPSGP
jgi:hypothetical protein